MDTEHSPMRRHNISLENKRQKDNAQKLVGSGTYRDFEVVGRGSTLRFNGNDSDLAAVKAFLRSEGSDDNLQTLHSVLDL